MDAFLNDFKFRKNLEQLFGAANNTKQQAEKIWSQPPQQYRHMDSAEQQASIDMLKTVEPMGQTIVLLPSNYSSSQSEVESG